MGLGLRNYIELRENWVAEHYSGTSANIPKLRNLCWKICNSPCGYLKHVITKDAFVSGTTRLISNKVFVDVAYGRGLVLLQQGNEMPKGRDNFGFFFSINNAWYSIAFGTYAKMAEPIEMPFYDDEWAWPKEHGGDDSRMRRGNFGGKHARQA